MSWVVLAAATWGGTNVPATFTVQIDGVDTTPAAEGIAVVEVPEGASAVSVRATPQTSAYWEATTDLTVGAGQALTPDDPTAATVDTLTMGDVRITRVTMVVSRLRDATAAVLAELAKPPPTRTDRTFQPPRTTPYENPYASDPGFPTDVWAVPWPEEASVVDAAAPISGGRVATVPAGPLAPGQESVVLELAGVSAPRLISVTWPDALARDEGAAPTPFLVYLRPGTGQNVAVGNYVGQGLGPYPFNFDYAYFGLFQYLWFAADPLIEDRYPKGIPIQAAVSGKDVVTVLPCNGVGPEFGVLLDAAAMQDVLLEIQALMFRSRGVAPPRTLGRTALAAFSSGNGYAGLFLGKAANRRHPFVTDTLREVYLFDPPKYLMDSTVANALAWAGPPARGRSVRVYSQFRHDAHTRVLGKPGPPAPYVSTVSDGMRTVGVIPVETWKATAAAKLGVPVIWDWQDAHQLIASFMLTHALAVSGF